MAKFLILGFSTSRGVSREGKGSRYDILRLVVPSKMRSGKNENWEGNCAGYSVDDKKCFNVSDDPVLVSRLMQVNYPCYMELIRTDDPENPTATLVSDFKVIGDPIKLVLP